MRRTIALLFLLSALLFARGGGGCFLPGTLVEAGNASVAIEDVSPGMAVLSFRDGTLLPSTVSSVYLVERDHYYRIETEGGSVNVTAEHPFYTSRGFVESRNLVPGDTLYALGDGSLGGKRVLATTRVDEPTRAYNLNVGWPDTFFANGFAVHNKGGGGGGGGSSFSSGSSSGSGKSEPPDNIFVMNCDRLAANESDCCDVRASFRKVGFYNITAAYPEYTNCRCLRQGTGKWEVTDSMDYGYSECRCVNLPGYNPASVERCFDWTPCCCVAIFILGIPLLELIFRALGISPKGARSGSGEWSSTIAVPKGKVVQKARKVAALLSLWGKVDPLWQEERMKADAKNTFLKLQDCWGKRDYAEMKPLMQEALYSQHAAQLEAMKARHEINKMEDLKLIDLQLVLVNNHHDKQKDEFTAWVNASARDTIVDDRTGKKIRGDAGAGVFEEFWTFRRDGDSWKLRKIDQPEEGMNVITKENFDSTFTPDMMKRLYEKAGGPEIKKLGVVATRERDEGAVPESMDRIKWKSARVHRLLNFLVQQDRMWDEEKMRTLASSLFIAFNVSLETRNLDSVRDAVWPELYENYRRMVADLISKKQRVEKRNLAVRNLELVLVKNHYDSTKDEFTAWISGQAQSVLVDDATGNVLEGDGHVADFEEFWTFRRDGDRWKLLSIERGFKKYVDEENFEEGADKTLLEWYYTRDRGM